MHIAHPRLNPRVKDIEAYIQDLPPGSRSGRHRHMAEEYMFVLEGEGYDISDGERLGWREGDMALVTAGSVHQHFNANPDRPARVLIKSKPLYIFANLMFQGFLEEAPEVARPGWEDLTPRD